MMSCETCEALVIDFIEGGLPLPDCDALRNHLDTCQSCVRFVESYKKTSSLCRHTLMLSAPTESCGNLMAFLRETLKCVPKGGDS